MTAFRENKLGMFIHWGIYAHFEIHEQVFARWNMDRETYEKAADVFNPLDYDPEEWVLTAKKAGMKYICFTAKHHDGFCMWDTKYTDYSIMHTPYGKDVLRQLADACEKHGMLLSIYYSNPDWHYEYGYNPHSSHQWRAKNTDAPDLEKLKTYIKNQIIELLTNYGKIYTLFWDIPPRVEDKSINELVRKLQPGIYINDRGFDAGDFSTPEREENDHNTGRYARMTEACESIGEHSWGYRENEDYHSIAYLTASIDKVMARGGNYLLNVGPKADGKFPEEAYRVLRGVGDWYNRMEGCLENTEEDLFEYEIRRYPYIVNRKNGKSYFHFVDGLRASDVCFVKFPCVPKTVRLMNTGKELPVRVERIPGYTKEDGNSICSMEALHIFGIPVDDLKPEPVVLEITWQ